MARILIADDTATNRELLRAILESEGHEVSEAVDGSQALEMLRLERPDLLISDILMPRMDGFELVRRVRVDADLAALRVVFCSASFLEQEVSSLALRCGVQVFLESPLVAERVLDAVRGELCAAAVEAAPPAMEGFVAEHLGVFSEQLRRKVLELERLNADLEQRVAQRTERLGELNAQLESFAYSVSHDLRGPLMAAGGFARLLEQEHHAELSETALGYLRRIDGGIAAMNEMIEGLLRYSRVAREDVPLGRVDLDSLIDHVLADLQETLREQGAVVRVERPLAAVRAHSTVLRQVVVNLVGNAAKFVPAGRKPRVRLWSARGDATVRLWVEDNGIGLAPGEHGRVFEVFARARDAKGYPGSGCGLAIARAGAQRMGGTIGVESAPGEGSRFWIELPADGDSA